MPDLPNSLSLTSIADGSQRIAAPVRNNFSSIQTAVNALRTVLAGGTLNQVLVATDSDTLGWGGSYTAYTPTWASSGVAPVIGNAAVVARYLQIGKLVHVYGSITFGGTSTYGTGNYLFALPVAPSASIVAQMTFGVAQLFDTSASTKASVQVELASGSNVWLIYPATWPSGTSTAVGQTTPWTWATGDVISWNLTYEAA